MSADRVGGRRAAGGGVAAALVLSVIACDARAPADVARDDLVMPYTADAGDPMVSLAIAPDRFPLFVDVARESGLAARICHAGRKDPQNWVLETIGGGAVVLDHDGDGDMDLLLVDGDGMDANGELLGEPDARTRLWRNEGGLRFTDVTDAAGIDVRGYGLGGAAADWDGDGHTDVAVTGYRFLRLLRNRGDGTFADVTRDAGLPPETLDTSTSCAWGDLDRDGRLDLFVTNYADQHALVESVRRERLAPRHCLSRGIVVFCGPLGLARGRNRLWFQRKDGTFEDRTATHLPDAGSYSFQCVLSDLDLDGDLDAYVANDGVGNFLFVNDGTGRFAERAVQAGAATDAAGAAQASMGVDVGDYDRDGRLDVLVTNFSEDHHTLYRNRTHAADRPSFEDASARSGIGALPRDRLGWGTKLADLDNDGVLDAFVACGHVYPECESMTRGAVTNFQRPLLVRGFGPPHWDFEDRTDRGGAALGVKRLWRGAAFADFDDDGDWDVLATAMRDPPALLRNDGGNRGAWVRLDIRGRPPLTSAAGARAVLDLGDGRRLVEELHLGSSYGGSNDPRLLVGTGGIETVPRIDVTWPDGTTTSLRDVPARRTVVVRQEGAPEVPSGR